MARRQKPAPGKVIASIVYSSLDALADAVTVLEKKFGRVVCETLDIPCCDQKTYREEMGEDLIRRFVSFDREIDRSALFDLKCYCYKVEQQFSDMVGDFMFRTVNIDPGIITPANIVIASHHDANYKIYLKDGVFSEIALIHGRGRYLRLPWTNDDYCSEEAISFFERVRDTFEILEPIGQ